MANYDDLVRLAIDGHKNRVEKFSTEDSQKVLREALLEANNGSTTLNYRDIRDGKCVGLFTILETILDNAIVTGLSDDDYFTSMVDFVNVAEGDQNLFLVEDATLYAVDEVSNGNQGIRRQRLSGYTEVKIPTTVKAIRIYEELNRVLSGRVDFNHLIDVADKSFRQQILNDCYTAWSGITADDLGGTVYFPAAGAYDEEALLDVIAHVEAAANGQPATIIGTAKALRNLKESIQSETAKDELHTLGYYGTFYGTPVVKIPQRHKTGTTEFVFDDNVLTIVATGDKPVKFVYEGDPLIIMGDPFNNADLTQEYFYGIKTGTGIIIPAGNAGIGRYEIA